MLALGDPIITWQIKKYTDTDYIDNENYFAGTYNKENNLDIELLLWNNRNGSEPVKNLSHFNITLSFEALEDSTLLNYINFYIDGNLVSGSIDANVITFPVPEKYVLSGQANDGSLQYNDNYLYLNLSLTIPAVYKIKENDLKTMSLDVVNI